MRRLLAFAAAVPLAFAAACGSSQPDPGPSPTASAAPAGVSADAIEVRGAVGKKPEVKFPAGNPALVSASRTISEGGGEPAEDGDILAANVTVYNWDGKDNPYIGSDYDLGRGEFVTVSPQLPKVLYEALRGAKPGGRVMAVVAKDALSSDQIEEAKQQGTDFTTANQVLVIDIVSKARKAVTGPSTDPGIKGIRLTDAGEGKAPSLSTKTDAKPSGKLVVKTVIKGDGPKVKADQTVVVHYIGKIWGSDKQFDSSWERGSPSVFPLSQVVKGWSDGLTGVPVGSRVVITIPPELGYGKEGNAQAGIKGTDTLVFVVDVLGAV
ncbi:FKBP-type peptidyl-prolyl cis-trans isomerase [Thermobispora bispora]|uniref:peptidylprolyl isomerase n=1 Tax=Thermobispora bispora (strain ATCC 19993 / DSM 43833 / CBS 139.67 / JCM 10125 / KCTC 9307 / NBRC 14880 / R51) TaxID=469371 RepID=D6YBI0_THEBD|nr:FKBP-type peptidyl-prolyl cis-trans isomerase [Thermobispora bispora]ADG88540.1 peptidylprolyl isomerase FKBP-type [Thermobispora bispora DSM 43833]